MEIRQLEYFVAVAEMGGFTRAAEVCHVVQTTVSHAVAMLERELAEKMDVDPSVFNEPIAGLYAGGNCNMCMPAIAFGGELQMWAYLSGKTAGEKIEEYLETL